MRDERRALVQHRVHNILPKVAGSVDFPDAGLADSS